MANTYVQIGSTVTVGGAGAATIDFTSIPATFTDLAVLLSARGTAAAVSLATFIKFNASTTGYQSRNLYGTGSATGSNTSTDGYIGDGNAANATANTFSNNLIYIPNYAGSTNKSVSVDAVSETNGTAVNMGIHAQLLSNTAAITSISLSFSSGNFAQYSTASLYGIKST